MATGITATKSDDSRNAHLVGLISIDDPRHLVFIETPASPNVVDIYFHVDADPGLFRVPGKRRDRLPPTCTAPGFLFHFCSCGRGANKGKAGRKTAGPGLGSRQTFAAIARELDQSRIRP